jgi:hypothetical protein
MKGVHMSADTIVTIISVATMLIALAGGFGWTVQRMDARFAEVNARFVEVNARIDRVTDELTEVKVAVARLEGPPPRLITAR